MHPAQLSLLPDQVPVPAPMALAELPEEEVDEAISLLGSIIAKASVTTLANETQTEKLVSTDE